ncbi:hypothetical protein HO133_001413 [Letharia lupina]|uniref:DSC E3 ubiquitin ligase complex subunit A n=1 Tax=Letharia lupina TaxID=560253 RepID=A0A8H6CF12_9LECA|nr:uncharacterized protein HO133_001413 [Letharia lupina]KAF6222327.1 hypothetical protein HO133_001413 [Letharia lupina]
METPRFALVVFLLLFLFLSPDSQAPSLSQQRDIEHSILEERQALDFLNTSSYGGLDTKKNRWLNVTGLRQNDGYAWDLLLDVQERAKEQLQNICNAFEFTSIFQNASLPSGKLANDGEKQNTVGRILSTMKPFYDPAPLYQNVTGIVRGHWTRSKIGESLVSPSLNLTALTPRIGYVSQNYNRNITGRSGDLRFHVHEGNDDNFKLGLEDDGLVRDVKATMTIKDESSSGDGWEMSLFGIHYPLQGGIILSTTSEKFAGIFALPHFTLSERAFSLAQRVLNQTLMASIDTQEAEFGTVPNPWTSSPHNPSDALFPVPHCEFIVYLQQHPNEDTNIDFGKLEKELRFPTGSSMPSAPTIRMSALIFSPDCGFVLESQGPPDFAPQEGLHLNGQKLESYMRTARRCIIAFAAVTCAQVFLSIRQMKDASTPSTKSRVSFYTIAMMALGDGFACMGFMFVSMMIDAAFLPLISTAFLSFLGVSFFGMKFLMDIWTIQAPERQERDRERQRPWNETGADNTALVPPANTIPAPAGNVTAAGADTLPLPVTARRTVDTGATPIVIPSDQDVDAEAIDNPDNTATQPAGQTTTLNTARREMSALYSKFYFLLLGLVFLSLHATTWPIPLRSFYTNTMCFIYLSFWLPQINRNITRNCRRALRWEFVIGQSILRLAPIVYLYIVPGNVLFFGNDRNTAYFFIAWVWLQIWALGSQEILGPRFFVPKGWAPPAYEYHPILRGESDEESGSTMPIGFTQDASSSPTHLTDPSSQPRIGSGSLRPNTKIFDCAICTENISVPIVRKAGSSDGESQRSASAALSTTLFARRAYMVTPCRHVFHSGCLEGWMRYRLQCPICRDNLPPL